MGCVSSNNSRCRHCEEQYSSMPRRSFSRNVHHPPERQGDTYHVVALTSSTLGSIKLDTPLNLDDDQEQWNHEVGINKKEEFAMGMIEAKVWSNKMIDENIPRVFSKTPIRTPPGEPETIDVQHLMEGLEDYCPLRHRENHQRSFTFNVNSPEKRAPNQTWFDAQEKEKLYSFSDDIISEFDPELISTFRKALQELSPTNPFHIKPNEEEIRNGVLEEEYLNEIICVKVIEKKLSKITPIEEDTQEETTNGDATREMENTILGTNGYSHIEKERVVLYFTSLRGIRKTYEDCCYVRLVLKGLGVRVDERDVSMHSEFKDELRECLGDRCKGYLLPKVFVGERYIGGVEEIRRMYEDGKLNKVIGACEMMEDDSRNIIDACEACGDIRFLPCETCSGSCKVYYEYDEDDEEFEEQDEYGFHRCLDCNENGLVRCPICCY